MDIPSLEELFSHFTSLNNTTLNEDRYDVADQSDIDTSDCDDILNSVITRRKTHVFLNLKNYKARCPDLIINENITTTRDIMLSYLTKF